MNTGKSKPYAILVFGAPKSGKTSFAEKLSKALGAPFLNISKLEKDYNVNNKLALELIRQFSKSGNTMILEGLTNTEAQRSALKKYLTKAGYIPVLIWVQTDMNTIKQRMRSAHKSLADAKTALAESYKNLEAPSDNEKPLVISGKHTFESQYKNVINNLSEHA